MLINEHDNVEVLLQPEGDIPAGHKRALRPIAEGEDIIKYGYPIGHATRPIAQGEWVNEHNICTNLQGTLEYRWNPAPQKPLIPTDCTQQATFRGYLRDDGRAGIRNELWVIPTVGCVASLAQRLATDFERGCGFPTRAFAHTLGCSQLGCDHEQTRQLLCSLITHPNAGGVLVLGLGCENNQMSTLQEMLEGKVNPRRVRFLEAQKVEDEYWDGMTMLAELQSVAAWDQPTDLPLSMLRIGLKCGGSDGFSGITANPLLGRLSDALVAQGAATVLTEVPEMFGAETILMNRCRDEETFHKTVKLVNDFKEYYLSHGLPVGENPSPGNKAGGISTLEEKSLGCVQKGGSAPVVDVLDYGQPIRTQGLNLLCAPGNDLIASTALAASGCQMVLFTTGRGTPFGTCVPTLKVSTNHELAERKPRWIDYDAGGLLNGKTWEEATREMLELVIETASGKHSCNEQNGYHEIAIWKNGVTL